MHVANLKTRSLTAKPTGAQGRKTAFMRKLRQWVMLIHKLRKLGRTEEFFYCRHNGANIDKGLRRYYIHILNGHSLAHNALHTSKTNAELILQKFAHRTNAAIAQVIYIINRTHAIHKIKQIIYGSYDVVYGNRSVIMGVKSRGAEKFHLAAVIFLQVNDDNALAENSFLSVKRNIVNHLLADNFPGVY